MSIRNYTYTLAAGAQVTIEALGNYIYIAAATGTIEVAPDGENPFIAEAGLAFGPFPGKHQKYIITDTTGAPNTITVYVGDVPIRDGRTVASGNTAVTGKVNHVRAEYF